MNKPNARNRQRAGILVVTFDHDLKKSFGDELCRKFGTFDVVHNRADFCKGLDDPNVPFRPKAIILADAEIDDSSVNQNRKQFSLYDRYPESLNSAIYHLGIPIFAFGYGMRLMATQWGGTPHLPTVRNNPEVCLKKHSCENHAVFSGVSSIFSSEGVVAEHPTILRDVVPIMTCVQTVKHLESPIISGYVIKTKEGTNHYGFDFIYRSFQRDEPWTVLANFLKQEAGIEKLT